MTQTLLRDSDCEIACTRVYNAPIDLLYRMWSNPEHLTNWWGPRGFSTTTHAMEFKTDGIWRFTMHGPDGTDYPNLIRYTNITASRIEYEFVGGDGSDITVRVDFRDVDDGTEMNFRMTFPSPEIRQHVVEKFGAEEGLKSTVTRLGEYVAVQDPKALELVIVRQFDAPQELVWKALTEPAMLSQWLAPMGLDIELTADDAKVGGKWSLIMSSDFGMHEEASGEYLAIEPEHFLKLTHRWKKKDGTFKPTTTISYKLHSLGGKTTMTFIQTGFWSEASRFAHLCGWDSCVHKLTILVGAAKANRALSLTREFDAPLDLVWKCWSESDRLAKWFAPRPYTTPKCEIDLVPGGRFLLTMRSPEGVEHTMSAIICDIEPLSRIGWVFSAQDADGETAIQGGTMVMFEEHDGGTKLTVFSYADAFTEQGTFMVGGMEQGWNMTLDQLVESALATK